MLLTKNKAINYIFLLFLITVCVFSSCKKNIITPTDSKSDLLTNNNWIVDRFSYVDNTTVPEGKLNQNINLLKGLEFQFRTNNQVRALDKISKQVFNGGTWQLTDADKTLIIDVTGLSGTFSLVSITKNKLILRPNQKVFAIVDNNTVVNMEFSPTL